MKIKYHNKEHQVFLGDNGSLDTVIIVDGREHIFDREYAAFFRDPNTGEMTEAGLEKLAREVLADLWE